MPEMMRQAMQEATEGMPSMPGFENLTQQDKEALLAQMLGLSTTKTADTSKNINKAGNRRGDSMRSSKQALLKSKGLQDRVAQQRKMSSEKRDNVR
jgi:hypothetical protein